MKNNAMKVSMKDNVAVVVRSIEKGDPIVVEGEYMFDASEDIPRGHKVALLALSCGEKIFRYGEPIVETTKDIEPGGWVHVHNTRPISGDT
jgi:hypothetical protein